MNYKIYDTAKIINKDHLTIGHDSQIDDFVFFNAGEESIIGSFVHIACSSSIIGGGKLYMDHFSALSAGCRIITGSDDFVGGYLAGPTIPKKYTNVKTSTIRIGSHAILGTNAIVMPGITIGEGAVVGAGVLVRKDLEPWTVYVGADCRPIKKRDASQVLAQRQELLDELGISLERIIK
ncbi:acyltransferase [Psychrobacter jeotgali]|uniref:acyltransferase n=1 Tax=Psychrobacter jeotgali TaxID=179010 RepID=UPI00191836F6|nr:acyltransferase [Psychrobacter jeotgali]